MSEELVGCICSSLAGLMGAVREAVAAANALGAPSDVLPTGQSAAADAAGGARGEGGEQQGVGGLSPTHIASLLLLLLAIFMSAFRSTPALPTKPSREAGDARREDDFDPPVA